MKLLSVQIPDSIAAERAGLPLRSHTEFNSRWAEVSVYLRRQFWEDTPERRRELSEIMDEMDARKKFTMDDPRRRDAELRAQGE